MFVYGDVVYAQTWQVLTLKTVSSHLHMLLHHMALVSVRLFCKKLGNLQEFLGNWLTAYPGYQRFLSRAAGIFGVGGRHIFGHRPKPREKPLAPGLLWHGALLFTVPVDL